MLESPPKPRRRWFSYSLRTMFVAMTVMGIFLAYDINWIRQRHEFLRTTRQPDNLFEAGPAPIMLRLLGEGGWKGV
jgi:hypothetical protein